MPPSTERLGPVTPWRFSIPDRIGPGEALEQRIPGRSGRSPSEGRDVLVAVEDVVRIVASLQHLQSFERVIAERGAHPLDWLVGAARFPAR